MSNKSKHGEKYFECERCGSKFKAEASRDYHRRNKCHKNSLFKNAMNAHFQIQQDAPLSSSTFFTPSRSQTNTSSTNTTDYTPCMEVSETINHSVESEDAKSIDGENGCYHFNQNKIVDGSNWSSESSDIDREYYEEVSINDQELLDEYLRHEGILDYQSEKKQRLASNATNIGDLILDTIQAPIDPVTLEQRCQEIENESSASEEEQFSDSSGEGYGSDEQKVISGSKVNVNFFVCVIYYITYCAS